MGRVVITGPHKDPPSMAIYIILGTLKVTISFYQVLHSPTFEVISPSFNKNVFVTYIFFFELSYNYIKNLWSEISIVICFRRLTKQSNKFILYE